MSHKKQDTIDSRDALNDIAFFYALRGCALTNMFCQLLRIFLPTQVPCCVIRTKVRLRRTPNLGLIQRDEGEHGRPIAARPTDGLILSPYVYRKSDSAILVAKSAEDRP
jgi:hypothetical protein